jgi:hypothetical protein
MHAGDIMKRGADWMTKETENGVRMDLISDPYNFFFTISMRKDGCED